MLELLTDPAVWASFATLTILEIILGVDNVIFISIAAARLPREERKRARLIGLSGALVMRILLLMSIAWIVGLTDPFTTIAGFALSWRDVILLGGGLFLLYKASTEIFVEVEGEHDDAAAGGGAKATLTGVVFQIMLLDLIFSLDSVITAVDIAKHLEVMIAAVVVSIGVMAIGAAPIADFIERHPSTKMLALAFLVMVGMALMADGLHYHVERGFIYAAMVFAGGVEGLNLLRARKRRRREAA